MEKVEEEGWKNVGEEWGGLHEEEGKKEMEKVEEEGWRNGGRGMGRFKEKG